MKQSKAWYKSKGVWGGLLALAGAVAGASGITPDAGTASQLTTAVQQAVTLFGSLLAIYGRFKATQVIE